MLRYIAIINNLMLLFVVLLGIAVDIPNICDGEFWILLLMLSAGSFNLLFIKQKKDFTWLALILKTKNFLAKKLKTEEVKENKCPHCGKEL